MSKVSRLPPASAGEAAIPAARTDADRMRAKFTRMSSPRRRAGWRLLDLLPELGEQNGLRPAVADGAGAALQIEGAQVLAGHRLAQTVVGHRELALRETDDGIAMRHPALRSQEKEHVLLLADLRRARIAHGDRYAAMAVDSARQDHRHLGPGLALQHFGDRDGGDRHQGTVEPLALQAGAMAGDDDRGLLNQIGVRAFHGRGRPRRHQCRRGYQQAENGSCNSSHSYLLFFLGVRLSLQPWCPTPGNRDKFKEVDFAIT